MASVRDVIPFIAGLILGSGATYLYTEALRYPPKYWFVSSSDQRAVVLKSIEMGQLNGVRIKSYFSELRALIIPRLAPESPLLKQPDEFWTNFAREKSDTLVENYNRHQAALIRELDNRSIANWFRMTREMAEYGHFFEELKPRADEEERKRDLEAIQMAESYLRSHENPTGPGK